MSHLSPTDVSLTNKLRMEGILKPYTKVELTVITKNGGSAFACGDGDTDIIKYHFQAIDRPHVMSVYGGPLLLAPSFSGYQESLAKGLLENMKSGMRLKETESAFLYFHYPCALALLFKYTLTEVIQLAQEVAELLSEDNFFNPDKLFFFFHVKMEKKESIAQKTYRLLV